MDATPPTNDNDVHPIFTSLPRLLSESQHPYLLGRALIDVKQGLAPHELLAALHDTTLHDSHLALPLMQLARSACDSLTQMHPLSMEQTVQCESMIPTWFLHQMPITQKSTSRTIAPPTESRLMDAAQSVLSLFHLLTPLPNINHAVITFEFCSCLSHLCTCLPASVPLCTLSSQSLIVAMWDPIMTRVTSDDEARQTIETLILTLENDLRMTRQDLIQGINIDDDDEDSDKSSNTSVENEVWSDTTDSTASHSVDDTTPSQSGRQVPDHCRATVAWALMTRSCRNIYDDVTVLTDVGTLSWCHQHARRLCDESSSITVTMRGAQLLNCLFPVDLSSRALDGELKDDLANTLMSALRSAVNHRSIAIRDEVSRALILTSPPTIAVEIITTLLEWTGHGSDTMRGFLLDLLRQQIARDPAALMDTCANLAVKQLEHEPDTFSEANEAALGVLRFAVLCASKAHLTCAWKSRATSVVQSLLRRAKEREGDIEKDEIFRLRMPAGGDGGGGGSGGAEEQLGDVNKARARLIASAAEALIEIW